MASLAATYDRTSGALTLALDGPRNQLGFVLFALDEGLVRRPGGITILLDPTSIFPVTTPLQALPATIRATLPVQPPGWRLVMQGAGWDAAGQRVYPAHQQWIQW